MTDPWESAEEFRQEVEAILEKSKAEPPIEATVARRWRKAKQIDGHHDAVIAHKKGRVILPLAWARFIVGPGRL